jgi:hypothetical protein
VRLSQKAFVCSAVIAVVATLFFEAPCAARGISSDGSGLGLNFAFGIGSAQIQNPDSSAAIYRNLNVAGGLSLPLLESKNFSTDFRFGLMYLDLRNTANNGQQSEVASMFGTGAGLQMRAYNFVAGYDYYVMKARHYTVGINSRSMIYDTVRSGPYFGLQLPLRSFSIGLIYNKAKASVPSAQSGLGADSPYSEETYWLAFSYSTGISLFKAIGSAF